MAAPVRRNSPFPFGLESQRRLQGALVNLTGVVSTTPIKNYRGSPTINAGRRRLFRASRRAEGPPKVREGKGEMTRFVILPGVEQYPPPANTKPNEQYLGCVEQVELN